MLINIVPIFEPMQFTKHGDEPVDNDKRVRVISVNSTFVIIGAVYLDVIIKVISEDENKGKMFTINPLLLNHVFQEISADIGESNDE